jgi:cysteine-rich repeat protein
VGVVVDSEDRIVLAGTTGVGAAADFTVARLKTDGSLDDEFGSGGSVTTGVTTGQADLAFGLAQQPNAEVVVVGAGFASDYDFALTRLFGSSCGVGVAAPGGECDEGAANGIAGSCCTDLCHFISADTVCRDVRGDCDVAESCTGTSGSCPADGYRAEGTVCDDHIACTPDDQCQQGICQGTRVTCGDGTVELGCEDCDDGNAVGSDGCDTCVLTPTNVSESVAPGATLATDGGAEATASRPIQTAVSIPSAGTAGQVTITQRPTSSNPAASYYLRVETEITAPNQTASDPLQITFRLDPSIIPPGESVDTIQLFHDGLVVADCPGAIQAVTDDPCIAARQQLGDGDLQMTLLTSAASVWNIGVAACPPIPRPDCREPITSGKAKIAVRDTSTHEKDRLTWMWGSGEDTPLAAFGDPRLWPTYTLCIYDDILTSPETLVRATISAGGKCVGKPCWKSAGSTGFRFSDKLAGTDGIADVLLKAGVGGKAKLVVKGKGSELGLSSSFAVTLPVTVQLRAANGECWSATYSTATKNDGSQFKARAD